MFKTKSLIQPSGKYVNPDKVLLWELTRREVRESLKSGSLKAAILPTGSTEQHNEHLALCTDFAMATLIAQQVALKLYPKVIVSTPCPVGYAPYHMGRKGTLTLRKETFQAYVFDVLESLTAHGINTILIVNGHAGNHTPLEEMLPEWRSTLGITLDSMSYWQVYTDEDLNLHVETHKKYKAGVNHAAEFETSVVQAAWPERVRSVKMHEYDDAQLDYDKEADSSFAKFYIRHFGKPYYGDGNENVTDRERQEQALYSNPENGLALIGIATEHISKMLDEMILVNDRRENRPE
jgi:creatinine amidohydrolase/Fe(II)-dependent formamide hydrolase-like protein